MHIIQNNPISPLRDHIAVNVLQTALQNLMKSSEPLPSTSILKEVAFISYHTADAMIEARALSAEFEQNIKAEVKQAETKVNVKLQEQKITVNKEEKPQAIKTIPSLEEFRGVVIGFGKKQGKAGLALIKALLEEQACDSITKLSPEARLAFIKRLEGHTHD